MAYIDAMGKLSPELSLIGKSVPIVVPPAAGLSLDGFGKGVVPVDFIPGG